MMPTDDHPPAPPVTDEDADRLQMQREATALRWMLAVGLVYAAFELTRLADRIAEMFDTAP